jgi:hypothetical protein
MLMRFSTAERFLMLSSPRNRSCFTTASDRLCGGFSTNARIAAAIRCMEVRLATNAFRRVVVGVFAPFAASGSSVQGCTTTSGVHAAMTFPEPPLLPSVAKPLM